MNFENHLTSAPNVVRFAKKLDAVPELLDATSDGLAAALDLMDDGTEAGFKPIVN